VLSRAVRQDGFGLIELLVSMVILNVGILALVAAFQSGAFALQRASKLSSAAAIADIQMERYRALTYSAIALDAATFTTDRDDAVYAGDAAYSDSQVTTTCVGVPDECRPIRTLTGPDGKNYRIDTYIVSDSVSSSRIFKRVTIVVRDANLLSGRPLARIASTFDESTG
jgi:type II secretory pathway pseudopilin PulG